MPAAQLVYGNNPACEPQFLSFLKTEGDPKLRMGLNAPEVQGLEACCMATTTDVYDSCENKLSEAYAKAVSSPRWQAHEQLVQWKGRINQAGHPLSEFISILKEATKEVPKSSPIFTVDDIASKEANAGVVIGTGLVLGAAALILSFQNVRGISQETMTWFREDKKPAIPTKIKIDSVKATDKETGGEKDRCEELINLALPNACRIVTYFVLIDNFNRNDLIPHRERIERELDPYMYEIERIEGCMTRFLDRMSRDRACIDYGNEVFRLHGYPRMSL